MEKFDYEKSVWGRGEASFSWFDPTSFRFWRSFRWLKENAIDGKILEVGCGAGQFISAFKRENFSWDCYGADISEKAIQEARKRNDGVFYDLVKNDDILPYPNNYFSAVLIFDVLEHVDVPEKILQEVVRVLKPGGLFYCFVPCESDRFSFWKYLNFSFWKNLTRLYAGHINRWSRKDWINIFSKVGFKIKNKNYSEHFLGQIIGVAAFYLMHRHARKNSLNQINNEYFFSESFSGRSISFFKKIVNFFIYWESRILRKVPSPNLHVLLEKNE